MWVYDLWICWLVYSYKTCADQSIDDIFLIALFYFITWKYQGLKRPQSGLARWPDLAGTVLAGLLGKHAWLWARSWIQPTQQKDNVSPFFTFTCEIKFRCMFIFLAECSLFSSPFFIINHQNTWLHVHISHLGDLGLKLSKWLSPLSLSTLSTLS